MLRINELSKFYDTKESERVVASGMLRAFSDEVTPEIRIMIGKYGRRVPFRDPCHKIIAMVLELNKNEASVRDPNILWKECLRMGCSDEAIDDLLSQPLLTEDFYNCIRFATGIDFDIDEMIETVAMREADRCDG